MLNVASYILLEPYAPSGLIWIPVLVTLIYGDIMLYINYQRKVDGPYPFLRVYHQSKKSDRNLVHGAAVPGSWYRNRSDSIICTVMKQGLHPVFF